MKQELQTEFPQEIKSVYFQRWIGEQKETGNGTDFYIEFKKVLSRDIKLEKIYFRNQVTNLKKVGKNIFFAHFPPKNINLDLIMDRDSLKEYGNKAPVITKGKFDLKPDEAVLEYTKMNKTQFYKIINVKEKPAITHPSMK
ncbi:hypothetical protein [Flavobacterium sp. ZS1P14]|uniref:hypothetical protein n=1 Tax=Flavobacterium sp. ZS1P14 TaxID=3401729 RepID=UPI003AAC953C